MKLPRYVIIENKQELVMPFVLMTRPPYLIGRPVIYRMTEEEKIDSTMSRIANGQLTGVRIPDMSGFMLASGSLTFADTGDIEVTKATLREMAEFFLNERVIPHKKKYKPSIEPRKYNELMTVRDDD